MCKDFVGDGVNCMCIVLLFIGGVMFNLFVVIVVLCVFFCVFVVLENFKFDVCFLSVVCVSFEFSIVYMCVLGVMDIVCGVFMLVLVVCVVCVCFCVVDCVCVGYFIYNWYC